MLVSQGDWSEGLYLLRSGRLTATVRRPDGETTRLRTMRPGSIIGEVGFSRGERRTATVVADVPSAVWRLSKASIEEVERQDPEVAASLHRLVASVLAERLANAVRDQAI